MITKTPLQISILFMWFCLIGIFIAKFFLDPQLPIQIQNYLETSTSNLTLMSQYLAFIMLLISSVALWSNKKSAQTIFISTVILWIIMYLISGPEANYQWTNLFKDAFTISLGIVLGRCIIENINPYIIKTDLIIWIFRSLVIIMLLEVIFSPMNDKGLPKAFIDFQVHPINAFSDTILPIILYFMGSSIALLFRSNSARYAFTAAIILLPIFGALNPDALSASSIFFCALINIEIGCIWAFISSEKTSGQLINLQKPSGALFLKIAMDQGLILASLILLFGPNLNGYNLLIILMGIFFSVMIIVARKIAHQKISWINWTTAIATLCLNLFNLFTS